MWQIVHSPEIIHYIDHQDLGEGRFTPFSIAVVLTEATRLLTIA